jgi:hypothetical protein
MSAFDPKRTWVGSSCHGTRGYSDAPSDGFIVWTTAISKISILTYREEQDVQDIPHPGGHHDQFEARRAYALAGSRRR